MRIPFFIVNFKIMINDSKQKAIEMLARDIGDEMQITVSKLELLKSHLLDYEIPGILESYYPRNIKIAIKFCCYITEFMQRIENKYKQN